MTDADYGGEGGALAAHPTGEVGDIEPALRDIADDFDAAKHHWKATRVREAADLIQSLQSRLSISEGNVERANGALKELVALVSVMTGYGPNCIIPEEIRTPLGVSVKVGAILRNARTCLASLGGVG